jgi:hypothetical protein
MTFMARSTLSEWLTIQQKAFAGLNNGSGLWGGS